MPSPRTLAIVDPYDAGTMLPAAFARYGVSSVMVGSTPDIPGEETVSFDPAEFHRLLFWRDDIDATVAALREDGVDSVIAGSERGVILADRLAEGLGAPGNGTALSPARRDKFLMIEQLRCHGVRGPRQLQSDTLDAILSWSEAGGHWPIVLKPRCSKGADGVRLCASREAVVRAFRDIHGRVDRLGFHNDTVLAQEYLRGREYVVDTVSRDGRHRLAGLWVYGKPAPDYDTLGLLATKELLATDGPLANRLFDFAKRVLDALGIRHGAGHCEIIVDDVGPALVEIGARLHGGPPAHLMSRAVSGDSQLDMLVRSCVAPSDFLAEEPIPTVRAGGATMVLLRDGGLKGTIERLPSAWSVVWNGREGGSLPAVAGLATLIHADRADLEADLEIATGRLSCDLLTSRDAVAAIVPAWRSLLYRSRCNRAFGSPARYLAALDAQTGGVEPLVVSAFRDGVLAGIFPLVRDKERSMARFATPLSDYNDVVVAVGDLAAARCLMAFARGRFPNLDLACVRADADCALAEGRPPFLTDRKFLCPFADLSDGFDDWLASRSPRFRERLGQAERRAAAQGLRAARLEPRDFGTQDLSALFLEMQDERFGARSLFMRDPIAAAFVTRGLPRLFRDGDVLLFGLRAEERLVGLNICVLGAAGLGYWNAGFRSAVAAFSPGTLMIHAALREACVQGFSELDFLRGEEEYKMKWCSGAREIGRLS
ncbi:GNAT family N-acetyltransferase [Telmatospirillum siberiense]|uniref:GNAT family N-acetyltransferase n=1 Tax=Telmatospirillum siberiense TaxID=382514 RepID=UPI0013047049|nr:GNAT family N-acetyltransferase [Telmatospirillum siberiense]